MKESCPQFDAQNVVLDYAKQQDLAIKNLIESKKDYAAVIERNKEDNSQSPNPPSSIEILNDPPDKVELWANVAVGN